MPRPSLVRRCGRVACLAILLVGAVGPVPRLEAQDKAVGKPALYYFVIDRSGSIRTNNLVVPIHGALIQKIGEVPENAEIRIILFDRTAARRGKWGPITTNARGEINLWFGNNFRPQGDTRLYDTVGEALTEIKEIRAGFSFVQLVILSDGIESPQVSTRFLRWADLAELGSELKQSDPPFFGTWYTLGFHAPDKPDPNGGIDVVAVSDPRTIWVIKTALQADFEWAPSAVYANEPVTLIDTSQGLPDRREWALPGGGTATHPRPEVLIPEAGEHTVTLTVVRGGERNSIEKKITVSAALAKADFTVSASSGTAPLEVQFQDGSRGDVVSYAWDFGDGSTSDLRNPVHRYSQPGTFTPRLTIRHSKGGTAKSAGDKAVVVKAPLPVWVKWLAALAAAALGWVVLVVPLVLKPIVLPREGVALKGLQSLSLRQLSRKHRFGWLWPRGDVTIGSRSTDFVRVGTGGKTCGIIHRRVGTESYVLQPHDPGSIRLVKNTPDVMGKITRSATAVTTSVLLRDGDEFEFQGSTFSWVQPARKARR